LPGPSQCSFPHLLQKPHVLKVVGLVSAFSAGFSILFPVIGGLVLAAAAPQVFDHTPQETICTALFDQDVSHLWLKDKGEFGAHSKYQLPESSFLKLHERDTITAICRLAGSSVGECV